VNSPKGKGSECQDNNRQKEYARQHEKNSEYPQKINTFEFGFSHGILNKA
jgi:hypothetical protein